MMNEQKNIRHGLILEDRTKLSVSGVSEVVGFDEETVVAKTEQGALTVKGKDLKVLNFTTETGSLNIEGTVTAMLYTDKSNRKSVVKKLLG